MDYTARSSKWNRVSSQHPCPICAKSDWCLFTGPADSPNAVICARIESGHCVGSEGAGWLHRLRDDRWRHDLRRQCRVKVKVPAERATDFAVMAHECYSAMGAHLRGLHAEDLGVSTESLHRLRVGWSACHRATTWPMQNSFGNVCGIRLRAPNGRKWSVRGSRAGLFMPEEFAGPVGDIEPFTLVITEGASDCAALLDLHFNVVGRPSCSGGVSMLVDLVGDWHMADEVVIFADRDAPGQRGARYLCSRLVGYVHNGVRLVTPPAKDVREWVRNGATRDDILSAIESAPILQLRYGVKAGSDD